MKTGMNDTERPLVPVYFRNHIDQVTGHRAVAETAASGKAGASAEGAGWVRKSLRRLLR